MPYNDPNDPNQVNPQEPNWQDRLNQQENFPQQQQQAQDQPGPGLARRGLQAGRSHVEDKVSKYAGDAIKDAAGNAFKRGGQEVLKEGGKEALKQGAGALGKAGATAATESLAGAAATGAGTAAAGAGGAAAAGAGGIAAGTLAGGAAGTAAPGVGNVVGAAAGATAATAAAAASAAPKVGKALTGVEASPTAAIQAATGVDLKPTHIVKKHWGWILAAAIVVPMSLFVGLLFVASPFKVDIATKQTAKKAFDPIQTIVEERTVFVLAGYAISGSKASIAEGMPQAGGKAGQLYTAMRDMGFEELMKDKYQLYFAEGNENGTVRVVSRGIGLGDANTTLEARNLLVKSSGLKGVIQNELHSWDWAQHTKIAQPAKSLYKNAQLNIPGAEDAQSSEDLTDLVKYQVSTTTEPTIANVGTAMGCMLGNGGCNEQNTQPGITATAQLQENESSSLVQAATQAYEDNLEDIGPETNYEAPTLRSRSLGNLTAQLTQQSLPLFGWLDVGTVVDFGSNEEAYRELPAEMRSQQAGSLFLMAWIGSSQSTAEKINYRSASILAKNFANMEESQGYGYVAYDNTSQGKPLADYQKVNSASANPMETFETSWKEENPQLQDSFGLFNAWNAIRNLPIFGGLIERIITTMATNPLINLGGDIIASSPLVQLLINFGPQPLSDLATYLTERPLTEVIGTSFGLSSDMLINECDMSLRSYNFFNCMVMGAQDLYVKTCEEQFGCGDLSPEELQELYAYRKEADKENLAALPWQERLFDTNTPNSLASTALLKSPMPVDSTQNVASFIRGLQKMVEKIPQNLGNIIAGKAMAANSDGQEIGNIELNKGIKLSKLQTTPLSSQVTEDGGTCAEKVEGADDLCYSDSSVIDGLSTKFVTYQYL